MQIAVVIAVIGAMVFLAHLFAALFARTRIPDVLLLFVLGIVLGPMLKVITPAHFGALGPIFTTITLVVILFESGTGLQLGTLRRTFGGTLALTAVNFLVTTTLIGLIVWLSGILDPIRSFMLGAILGGTSSAIVIPLTRQLRMADGPRTMLILESALSDVLCIVVALALLAAHKQGEFRIAPMMIQVALSFIIAALIGGVTAFVWSLFLGRIRMLQNSILTTPAFVLVVFGLVELLGCSGAIAALVFGAVIANLPATRFNLLRNRLSVRVATIDATDRVFFAEIAFLIKTFFFLYMGVSIRLTDITSLLMGLGLSLMIVILRIPVVWATVPRTTSRQDAAQMAVIFPKGLAAAVLAAIPLQQGVVGGELIQNITYATILGTIVLTSLLVLLLSRTGLGNAYQRLFRSFSVNSTPTASNPDPVGSNPRLHP